MPENFSQTFFIIINHISTLGGRDDIKSISHSSMTDISIDISMI